MNKSLVYISALVFFCVSFQSGQAQTIPFRSFSIEQGLSESVAHDLIQDHSGYIWVATGYGLNRFDGIRFQPYYEEQGLADNQVNALFEDRSNRLWVGTDSGISILENDTLITPAYLEPISHTTVQGIFQDREGNFWMSTDGNGIWRLDTEHNLTNVTDQFGYQFAHGRAIAETADGTIWVA
ncbi:MAG: two-component regulator propeller domain-containing protein, partial [Balneolaceae bacterium]